MKIFEYGDQEIGKTEVMILLPSFIHGVIILTISRVLNTITHSFDGWISILIGGGVASFFAWIIAKLSSRFPNQTFFEFTAKITSKPIAYLLTFAIMVHFLLIVTFEVSAIGEITQIYILPNTPVVVISLVFLLTVVYAVAGSRVGILRLNMLFFPIYFLFLVGIQLMSFGRFEISNIRPFFVTDWSTTLNAAKESLLFFVGFEVLLMYTGFVNRPKQVPKAAVNGMVITVLIALFIYIAVTGVMGVEATIDVLFPTIEQLKEVEIPGGFFERVEPLFYIIWIMTIFNTAAVAFDASLLALQSMFKRSNKMKWILLLSPIIFIIASLPKKTMDIFTIVELDTFLQVPFAFLIPPTLLMLAKIRKL